MKNKVLKTVSVVSIAILTTAYAETATWLDGGSKIKVTLEESNVSKDVKSNSQVKVNRVKDLKEESFEVTLATGATVTIIGGVYVKTTKPEIVLDWALENGYEAKKHKFIDEAINIKTVPQEAIVVANSVAILEGVTTAAPKQRKKLRTR